MHLFRLLNCIAGLSAAATASLSTGHLWTILVTLPLDWLSLSHWDPLSLEPGRELRRFYQRWSYLEGNEAYIQDSTRSWVVECSQWRAEASCSQGQFLCKHFWCSGGLRERNSKVLTCYDYFFYILNKYLLLPLVLHFWLCILILREDCRSCMCFMTPQNLDLLLYTVLSY